MIITENKNNYLYKLAQKLKAEVIHHNNFIGGRYSVLSETGMLPAELMGLNSKKFRQLNSLVKNKKYLNALISNVSSTIFFLKKKKHNSVIINYDKKSENLFFTKLIFSICNSSVNWPSTPDLLKFPVKLPSFGAFPYF